MFLTNNILHHVNTISKIHWIYRRKNPDRNTTLTPSEIILIDLLEAYCHFLTHNNNHWTSFINLHVDALRKFKRVTDKDVCIKFCVACPFVQNLVSLYTDNFILTAKPILYSFSAPQADICRFSIKLAVNIKFAGLPARLLSGTCRTQNTKLYTDTLMLLFLCRRTLKCTCCQKHRQSSIFKWFRATGHPSTIIN